MAYGLPVKGQANYDDELNNSIEAVRSEATLAKTTADAASASAATAATDATTAKATANQALDFVRSESDDRVAEHVNDSTSATRAALAATHAPVFGAPAPSGGDDRAAIQARVDAAAAAGGGRVVLQRGAYSLGSSVALKSGVSIEGAGVGATTIAVTADVTAIAALLADTVTDAAIRDLSITGYGATGTLSDCINLDTATGVTVERVHADLGSLAGIQVDDCTRVTIRDCRVTNNKGVMYPAIGLLRGSGHIVTGCSTEGGSWVCIGVEDSTENTVHANTLRGNHTGVNVYKGSHRNRVTGNYCSTVGSGITVDGDTTTATRNVVSGNTCHANSVRGIFLNNAQDNTVTGNMCSQNAQNAGIYLVNSPRNQITGNTCVSNTGHGINLVTNSHDCTISGNRCQANTSDGISLATILRCSVTGNVTKGNTAHGINLSGGSAYNTVTGNNASENGVAASGIIVNSSRNTVTGNTCIGVGAGGQGHGIRVTAGTNNLIVGNTCYQNATANITDAGTTTTVANNVTT